MPHVTCHMSHATCLQVLLPEMDQDGDEFIDPEEHSPNPNTNPNPKGNPNNPHLDVKTPLPNHKP